jgi:hypothetical protein
MACYRAVTWHANHVFGWLVADGWCWFVLREEYCWLVAGGWFVQREKYCWLVADKPSEQAVRECKALSTHAHLQKGQTKTQAHVHDPFLLLLSLNVSIRCLLQFTFDHSSYSKNL